MKRALAFLFAAAALGAPPAAFDSYVLALSWAPEFCASPGGMKDPRECGSGRRVGFVVHGLWPQSAAGPAPQNCGGRPVSQSLVTTMLRYMPTEGLIQHEWKAHGTCSGLSPGDYFAAVRKARDQLAIPARFAGAQTAFSEAGPEVEQDFAQANPAFPAQAFRALCRDGALDEVRVCLDRNLKPASCPANVGRCRSGAVRILPPH